MKFNKKNFERSKQRIVGAVDKVSKKRIEKWKKFDEDCRRSAAGRCLYYQCWDVHQIMNVCLLILRPFNFRVSHIDIYDAVKRVRKEYWVKKRNSAAEFLWDATNPSPGPMGGGASSLESYLCHNTFFMWYKREKNFFERPNVKAYLNLTRYSKGIFGDTFSMLKYNPDIIKKIFQLAWWIGKELKKIEEK